MVSTQDIALALDSLTGDLLRSLDSRGIRDSTIVIVTGDHGLRFRAEFTAARRQADDPFLTFNVPFLMYAPGALVPHAIQEPTSHVDIVPALLSLLALRDDSLLLHGRSLLTDQGNRIVMLSSAGLSPYRGFALGDSLYVLNTVTGRVTRRGTGAAPTSTHEAVSDSAVRAKLEATEQAINETVAFQFAQAKN
jgi:arylsulfatase A-like enzyme